MIIIDGNALIHRSFHALPPTLITKKGEMVNAVYGFASVLVKAIRDLKPDYVVLTLDKAGPTFRHVEYKDYKATRVKAPDELYLQIGRVREVAEAFNIPIFAESGFEADDLIGTIVKHKDGAIEKIIVTGDMDTLQLVDEHTKVYTMSRGITDSVLYDEKAVVERYGLKPEQMIDYKALRGDPSDNIPGVKGIGEKTAVELLKEFKTLENLYKNLESPKIKDRIRELLRTYKNDALMSKSLATIKCDVDINFDLEATRFKAGNQEKIVELFSELEFKSLLPRVHTLFGERNKTHPEPSLTLPLAKGGKSEGKERESEDKFERNKRCFKYNIIIDDKGFEKFFKELKKQKLFAFDTETDSFDHHTTNLLGISFSWNEQEGYYLVINGHKTNESGNEEKKQGNLFSSKENKERENTWLAQLKPIFEDEKIEKYGHNIKFDYRVMKSQGVEVKNLAFDTMIASYLLNPGSRAHSLDAVSFTELAREKISKEDLLGTGKEKTTFAAVDTEKLAIYSCEDADCTFCLVNKLRTQLKEQNLEKLFNEIEMPLVRVLADMEDKGVCLDQKFLKKLSKQMQERIKGLEKEIFKIAGGEFNIRSTQQLREVLFVKLGISIVGIGKTKTGISTSAEELDKMKDLHPIIKLIQEYRELSKLTSTYVDALPLLVSSKTGRLHTSFNQTITATGRLSSTDPNLQNIPIRTDLGREIRKAFIAENGYKILSLDYSQIELRLAAHYSGDEKMIDAFQKKEDIHIATAAAINQVKLENVTKEMRREAKAVNFGIIYGQGPHGLSVGADIPYDRARKFIEEYFNVYKGVKKWIENVVEEAREKGYVETLFGRRRFLPEINSSVVMVRKGAERMAINAPLQGTAADIIKVAMIQIENFIKNKHNNDEVRMLIQVHDELLFEVKSDKVQEISNEIKKIMEGVINIAVPVVVEEKMGNSWGEIK